MQTFYSEVTETLSKIVEISADSAEKAVLLAKQGYDTEQIILVPDDYASTEFKIVG